MLAPNVCRHVEEKIVNYKYYVTAKKTFTFTKLSFNLIQESMAKMFSWVYTIQIFSNKHPILCWSIDHFLIKFMQKQNHRCTLFGKKLPTLHDKETRGRSTKKTWKLPLLMPSSHTRWSVMACQSVFCWSITPINRMEYYVRFDIGFPLKISFWFIKWHKFRFWWLVDVRKNTLESADEQLHFHTLHLKR